MESKLGSRGHQLLGVLTELTMTASAMYAVAVHLIRLPPKPMAAIMAASAVGVVLVLARLILLRRYDPMISILNASYLTVCVLTITVGIFGVFTLKNGSFVGALMPMIATLFGSFFLHSIAKRSRSNHSAS